MFILLQCYILTSFTRSLKFKIYINDILKNVFFTWEKSQIGALFKFNFIILIIEI